MKTIEKDARTIVDVLKKRAAVEPDRIAYIFLKDGEQIEETITYGELDLKVRAVASKIREHAGQGERALLLFESGIEYIIAFYGCLYSGVIAVPAFPPPKNKRSSRITSIITDCDAIVILTVSKQTKNIKSALSEKLSVENIAIINVDEIDFGSFATFPDYPISEQYIAFIQYTSGSTNSPKGVLVSHQNLMANEAVIKRQVILLANQYLLAGFRYTTNV